MDMDNNHQRLPTTPIDAEIDFRRNSVIYPSIDAESGLLDLGSIRIWCHSGIIEFVSPLGGRIIASARMTMESLEDILFNSGKNKAIHLNSDLDSDGNPVQEKYWLPYSKQPRTLMLQERIGKRRCNCGKRA